jgi:hypothetical protein
MMNDQGNFSTMVKSVLVQGCFLYGMNDVTMREIAKLNTRVGDEEADRSVADFLLGVFSKLLLT